MIVSGYYGELTVTGDLTPRWVCWGLSMSFFLYIVYELLGSFSCHQRRSGPCCQRQDPVSTAYDSCELVHIPRRVLVPHARHQRSACRCRYPDWLLCIRHHLQVRSRASDLPNHVCKVLQGMPVAMRWP